MTKEIPLTRGCVALVDDDDFEWITRWKWHATAKTRKKIYATATVLGKDTRMHRLIMRANDGQEVDHIDGNSLNNQRSNLRLVTHYQNLCNRIKRPNSYKGVFYQSKLPSPWRARITVNGVKINLGCFKTNVEAARAYDAASLKYHGEYGRRNFDNA